MLRATFFLRAVREHGNVFFRTRLRNVQAKSAQTPLLQERPYPLAEIVRRMVRVRIRYQRSQDEKERALLRGEYKFFTGKKCHLRDAEPADLVTAISCAAFFQFWDSRHIDAVLEQVLSRIDEMSALELCQLAQDLPRIGGRVRSPHLRAVFRRLCANKGEMLKTELGFEDHLDLIEHAVGTHCPLVFLQHLILLVSPRILVSSNTTSPSSEPPVLGISFNQSLAILDALVLLQQSLEIKSQSSRSSSSSTSTASSSSSGSSEVMQRVGVPLAKKIREQFIESCRSVDVKEELQLLMTERQQQQQEEDDNDQEDGTSNIINNNNNSNEADERELTGSDLARAFHQFATLGVLDSFSAQTFREWFLEDSEERIAASLDCSRCLQLCLTHANLFGARGVNFENLLLNGGCLDHISETAQSLNAADIGSLFEFILRVSVAEEEEHEQEQTKNSLLLNRQLREKFVILFDIALDQLLLLREASSGVWPVPTILQLLSYLNRIVAKSEAIGFSFLKRPQLHSATKSLCSSVITSAPSMDATECCSALADLSCLSESNHALDASLSSVARRLSNNNILCELEQDQIQDLITILSSSCSSSSSQTEREKKLQQQQQKSPSKQVIEKLLLPALRERKAADEI